MQNDFFSGKLRPAAQVTRVGRKTASASVSLVKQPEDTSRDERQQAAPSDAAASDKSESTHSFVMFSFLGLYRRIST